MDFVLASRDEIIKSGHVSVSEGWVPVKGSKKLHYFSNPSTDEFSFCGHYFWKESVMVFVKGSFSPKSYCEACYKKLKQRK